jgi:predicted ATP-grasp superfamily ATP-dependent carboligase
MIRSFGRRGWRVMAGDSLQQNLRFGSRYVTQPLLYPCPRSAPDEFVDAVREAVLRSNVDLVIPITDESLLPLVRARSSFPESCQLAVPDADTLEITTNKQKTLDLANRLGVPTPRTVVVATADEAHQHAKEFDWPIVLKPLVSRLYDGEAIEALTVSYADNIESLTRQMKQFEGRCEVLLQELVAGTGYGVELLTYEGRPLAAFQHERLREVPVTGGASALRQSAPLDPVLYDYALRMLGALKWTGLAMVEFKVGDKGPSLMEINGRVWGSLPLAVHSGVDFPARLANLFLDAPPDDCVKPQTQYRIGVRGRNLELDVVWMLSVLLGRRRYSFLPMPSRAAALKAIAGLTNPFTRSDILSLRDPLPGLAELLRIAHKLVLKSQVGIAGQSR